MLTLTKIQTHEKEYPFIEQLLHESFPLAERRDDDLQRDYTDHNPKFTCYLITDEEEGKRILVGLMTVWDLDGFHYGEHLATSPNLRNKGYGKQIMKRLRELYPDTFILEVERPTDEMAIRRIGFYKRCGFSLCEKDYMQPSYRKEGEEVPLYLMYAGTDSIDNQFESIRDTIYREVYGVK